MKKNKRNINIFIIILLALVIDLLIPDPLVFLDEIGLIILAIYWWMEKIK